MVTAIVSAYQRTTCPSCAAELERLPRAKKKCPACAEAIHVRSGPDGLVHLLREADLQAFERRWQDELREREVARIRAEAAEAGRRSLDEFERAGIGLIELLATEDACSACKRWAGRTLRLAEVPALPIPGCINDYCRCDYVPVID